MAFSDQRRDIEHSERLRHDLHAGPAPHPDPYDAERNAPSGRSIVIMFGVIIAIFLLIALFSWSSGDAKASSEGAVQANAIELGVDQ